MFYVKSQLSPHPVSTILHYWILPQPSDEKADCQNIWYNFITSNYFNLWDCSTESITIQLSFWKH